MCQLVAQNEVVVHEKLVFRLTKLRVSTCEAVLWEEFDKLPALADAFANINVTAAALAESGVGFLVADTSLWSLGGNPAVTYAEKAQKRVEAGESHQLLLKYLFHIFTSFHILIALLQLPVDPLGNGAHSGLGEFGREWKRVVLRPRARRCCAVMVKVEILFENCVT